MANTPDGVHRGNVNPNTGRKYSEGRGWGTYENMSRSDIVGRMEDPPDAKRMRQIDKLAAKAANGDAKALERLNVLAALPGEGTDYRDRYGKNYGAATRDARNYARLKIQDVTGQDQDFVKPGDAYIGDTLGKVAQFAAPIAGALIPGVGILGAGLIGAGGSALGQYGQYGSINPLKALASGGLAAAGNYALGNGLGSGSSNLGFGSHVPGALPGVPGGTTAATGPAGMGGNASAVGSVGQAAVPAAAATAGKSVLGTVGGIAKDYGPLILGGLGAWQAGQQYAEADKLRGKALDMASKSYQERAPVRDRAVELALAPRAARPDLSALYASGNPYARAIPRG